MNYFKKFMEQKKEANKIKKPHRGFVDFEKIARECSDAFDGNDENLKNEKTGEMCKAIDKLIMFDVLNSGYINRAFPGFNEDLGSILKMQFLRIVSKGEYDKRAKEQKIALTISGKATKMADYSKQSEKRNFFSLFLYHGIEKRKRLKRIYQDRDTYSVYNFNEYIDLVSDRNNQTEKTTLSTTLKRLRDEIKELNPKTFKKYYKTVNKKELIDELNQLINSIDLGSDSFSLSLEALRTLNKLARVNEKARKEIKKAGKLLN